MTLLAASLMALFAAAMADAVPTVVRRRIRRFVSNTRRS